MQNGLAPRSTTSLIYIQHFARRLSRADLDARISGKGPTNDSQFGLFAMLQLRDISVCPNIKSTLNAYQDHGKGRGHDLGRLTTMAELSSSKGSRFHRHQGREI